MRPIKKKLPSVTPTSVGITKASIKERRVRLADRRTQWISGGRVISDKGTRRHNVLWCRRKPVKGVRR